MPALIEVPGDQERCRRFEYCEAREAAVKALGRLGDPTAVGSLGSALLESTLPGCARISRAAAEALAVLGGERAADLLREVMAAPREQFGKETHQTYLDALAAIEARPRGA